MGNCLTYFNLRRVKRPVTLLLVGLDNAGKTSAVKGIVGDSLENVTATVGFSPESLIYRGCKIKIYDLGGGPRIRPVWSKYFSEVHAVIFVIDSSAKIRIAECQTALQQLIAHRRIAGKPILILANKQDIDGALDEIDLVESLKIEELVNRYKCPTRLEMCSAIAIRNKKPDKPIADGFRWLVDTVVVNYTNLQKRIVRDVEKEAKIQLEESERRKERLKLASEAREEEESPSRIRSDPITLRGQTQSTSVGRGQSEETTRVKTDEIVTGKSTSSFSEDAMEMRELGFPSSRSLESTTSSSEAVSKVLLNSSNASHTIEAHQSEDRQEEFISPSSAKSKSMNNLILSEEGSIELQASPQRVTECVPMDSDDEFQLPLHNRTDEKEEITQQFVLAIPEPSGPGISSVVAGVKEQIHLETILSRKPRKNILKRLHKTAPLPSPPSTTESLPCV